jgi:hypothetical protein
LFRSALAKTHDLHRTLNLFPSFFSEEIIYSASELLTETEDGLSLFLYLKTMYPQQWRNFLERVGIVDESSADALRILMPPAGRDGGDGGGGGGGSNGGDSNGGGGDDDAASAALAAVAAARCVDARVWATNRGQTLFRTCNGMFKYESALRLLLKLEEPTLPEAEIRMLLQSKFTYVISCQVGSINARFVVNRYLPCVCHQTHTHSLFPSLFLFSPDLPRFTVSSGAPATARPRTPSCCYTAFQTFVSHTSTACAAATTTFARV